MLWVSQIVGLALKVSSLHDFLGPVDFEKMNHISVILIFKACFRYFLSKFYFVLTNDSPWKIIKNGFYFI